MLAKIADELPREPGFLFEPKWDGFRAIVFRVADEVYIQSRDLRPLNRYFPELEQALAQSLSKGCVLDGEIVVAAADGLDFDALQQRLHPAASRVARLAKETPAAFVAFDLLAAGGRSTMGLPQAERRIRLERLLGQAAAPLYLTPMTRDRAVALDWLQRFEGAGLDGVVAKPEHAPYQPGKRAMFKIKHARTADCVVAGFRWYRDRADAVVGAAAARARVRSQVRPPPGRSLPACRGVPALATGQTARGLPLRPAGSHDRLRASEGVRGNQPELHLAQAILRSIDRHGDVAGGDQAQAAGIYV